MGMMRRMQRAVPNAGYVLDTNALIRATTLRVDADLQDRIWTNLGGLMDDGRATTVDVVFDELKRNAPECFDRVQARRAAPFMVRKRQLMVVECAPVLQRVLNDFPSMSGVGQPRDKADAWLVTLAATRGHVMVTQESRDHDQKIPAACRVLDVECIDLLELVIREGL